jgi:UDP-N-acetylglucosamine--dolichyl-phosphate N-acetylglucosaminephosphotransferase
MNGEISMRINLIVALMLASFSVIVLVLPRFIEKLKVGGVVAIDRYKNDRREIPTWGGVAILGVVFLLTSISTLSEHLSVPLLHTHVTEVDWAILTVAALFGAFGLVDDYIDVGRPVKIFLLFFFSFRLIFVIGSTMVTIPILGSFNLGAYYLLLIVPLYVLVAANLVNMHSGFNGLASGLSVIILASLLVKFVIAGYGGVFILSCFVGATAGFLWFNRYPARIFMANIGSLSLGAAIGAAIVVSGFLVAGFIMFIPHTVNFLLYVYWRVMHRLHPEDTRWKLAKFGHVREDGTLDVPNSLTLKWVLPYHYKMTERQAVLAMYALTIPFCVIGLLIPY